MTMPEVDHELERLFAVARTGTAPDAEARARIRAGLTAKLANGTGATARAGGTRSWLGWGAAVVGVAAIALWLTRAPDRAVGNAPVVSGRTVSAVEPAPSAAAVPAGSSVAATPAVEPSSAEPPSAEPPSAEPPAPSQANRAAPSSARSADRETDSAEELALVRSMQRALRSGDAAQALALTGEHARRFPRGMLAEEREGVRAVSQCQLAAPAARAAIGETFIRRFATSPYVARVRAACQ